GSTAPGFFLYGIPVLFPTTGRRGPVRLPWGGSAASIFTAGCGGGAGSRSKGRHPAPPRCRKRDLLSASVLPVHPGTAAKAFSFPGFPIAGRGTEAFPAALIGTTTFCSAGPVG